MDIPSLLAIFFLLVLLGLWIASAAWAVGDAQKRGYTGGLIVFLFWFLGPFAALVWRFTRPGVKIVEVAPSSYDNPDDAISAAVKLDALGEWDAAIALYQDAANRWPEHAGYIKNCVARIESKRASAS